MIYKILHINIITNSNTIGIIYYMESIQHGYIYINFITFYISIYMRL